jgi:hypothetical protein
MPIDRLSAEDQLMLRGDEIWPQDICLSQAPVHRIPKRFLSGVVPYMEAHLVRRVGETYLHFRVGESERAAGAYRAEGLLAAAEAESPGGPVEA